MGIGALFVTAFLVGLSGALMPGPLLTATIAESARRGFWAGPLIVSGHAILELLLIIALFAGLSSYLTRPDVTSVISLVGGAFLLYLGITMSRDAIKGKVILDSGDSKIADKKGMHPVIAGILVSVSNPFWSIWWATVGLAYLTLALESGSSGLISFYSGHILADLAWYSFIAAIVAGGRRWLQQKVYQLIIVLCGLFLFALGIYFIYSGLTA